MAGQQVVMRGKCPNPSLMIFHLRKALPLQDSIMQFKRPLRQEHRSFQALSEELRFMLRELFAVGGDAIDEVTLKPHRIIVEKAFLYSIEEVEAQVVEAVAKALGATISMEPAPVTPENLLAAAEAIVMEGAAGVTEAMRLTDIVWVTALLSNFYSKGFYPPHGTQAGGMGKMPRYLLGNCFDSVTSENHRAMITAALALL